MKLQLLNYEPFNYQIKSNETQNGKIIHIRVTGDRNSDKIIMKQSLLINKLKQQKGKIIQIVAQKNQIIEKMNQKIRLPQEKNQPKINEVISSKIGGKEYQRCQESKDEYEKQKNIHEEGNIDNFCKLQILGKENAGLKQSIEKLTKEINALKQQKSSQKKQEDSNSQLNLEKKQNEELRQKLRKLKEKYTRIKKQKQQLTNTINQIQAQQVEMEQEMIILNEVECQTDTMEQTISQQESLVQNNSQIRNPSQQNLQIVSNNENCNKNQYVLDKDQLINELKNQINQLKKRPEYSQNDHILNKNQEYDAIDDISFVDEVMMFHEVECQTDIEHLEINSSLNLKLEQKSSEKQQKTNEKVLKSQNMIKSCKEFNGHQYIGEKLNQISELQLKLLEKDKVLEKIVKEKDILAKDKEELLQQCDKLSTQNTNNNELLINKNEQIQKLQQQIAKLKQNDLTHQNEIQQLKKQLSSIKQPSPIDTKNAIDKQDELKQKKNSLITILQSKQQQIEQLKKQEKQMEENQREMELENKKVVDELKEQINERESKIEQINKQVGQLQQSNNQLRGMMIKKDQQIDDFEQKIKNMENYQHQANNNQQNIGVQSAKIEKNSLYHEVECQTQFDLILSNSLEKEISQQEKNNGSKLGQCIDINKNINTIQSNSAKKQPPKQTTKKQNEIKQKQKQQNYIDNSATVSSVSNPIVCNPQKKSTDQLQDLNLDQKLIEEKLKKRQVTNQPVLSESQLISEASSKGKQKKIQSAKQTKLKKKQNRQSSDGLNQSKKLPPAKQQPTKVLNYLQIDDLTNLKYLFIQQAFEQGIATKFQFKPIYIVQENALKKQPISQQKLSVTKQKNIRKVKSVKFLPGDGERERQMHVSSLQNSQILTPYLPSTKKKSCGILKTTSREFM